MKYFSAARHTRRSFAHDGDYRGLPEKTVSLQSASANSLSALQTDVAEMKIRLAAVEKMLCEVG